MAAPADKDSAADAAHDTTADTPTRTASATSRTSAADTRAAHKVSDTPGGSRSPRTVTRSPPHQARQGLRFDITGPDGNPVTEYDMAHEKKLHFIVAPAT